MEENDLIFQFEQLNVEERDDKEESKRIAKSGRGGRKSRSKIEKN